MRKKQIEKKETHLFSYRLLFMSILFFIKNKLHLIFLTFRNLFQWWQSVSRIFIVEIKQVHLNSQCFKYINNSYSVSPSLFTIPVAGIMVLHTFFCLSALLLHFIWCYFSTFEIYSLFSSCFPRHSFVLKVLIFSSRCSSLLFQCFHVFITKH